MTAILEKIWGWLVLAAGFFIASFVVFRKVKKSGADEERKGQLERGAELHGEVVDLKAELERDAMKRAEASAAEKIVITKKAAEEIKNAPSDAEADALLEEAKKRWPKP